MKSITQKIKSLYDRQYDNYSKKIDKNPNSLRLKQIVHKTLGDIRNKNVLFVGCGDGAECLPSIKAGAKVIGIDLSKRAIEIAKNRYKNLNVKFYIMDYEKTNFKTNFFDIIISINSIVYKSRKSLFSSLKEFRRILKTNGRLIIATPHPVRKMMKYSKMKYFIKGWRTENWNGIKRMNYYMLFEDYLDVFVKAKLKLTKIMEPRPVKDFPDEPAIELSYPHFVIFELIRDKS